MSSGLHSVLEHTTVSVFQEFYINMLFSNLSSLIKNQADEEIFISTDNSNKYRYQANRAFIIGRMKKSSPKSCAGSFSFLPLTGFLRMPYGADPRSSPDGLAGVRKVTQKEGHILIIKKLLFCFCVLVSYTTHDPDRAWNGSPY